MPTHDISLEKAELLSVLLEGFLYGFSLFMFAGTLWVLFSRQTTVNRKVAFVACLLLLLSTMHFVIDIIRAIQGLILFRDTFPGGANGYFSDPSQWTFVSKNYVYAMQTLVGDGVVLYRCYAAWQSKLVMILPVLLWCSVAVTGIASASAELALVDQYEVFTGVVAKWITSFWASTLITNLLTTSLLAYRIWYVDREVARLCGQGHTQLRPILQVIIDAGVIYSVTLFAALICFVNRSNAQYLILDLISPIISITFYMIIIRVGLAHRPSQSMNRVSTDVVRTVRQSRSVPVFSTVTQQSLDQESHTPPLSPVYLMSADNHHRGNKIGFEHVEEHTEEMV